MSWTSNTGLLDSLVRDYLLQRGFNSSLKSLDLDLKNDKEKGFRVDKVMQHILSLINSYDLDSLRTYWCHLDQRVFSLFEQTHMATVRKMELNLYRFYIVNSLQNGRRRECIEFYEKMSSELQGIPEWKDWFSLPFTPHPDSNKYFAPYFTKPWSDTFLVSLQNFLAITFSCLPSPELLASYEKDQAKINKLESENELLRLHSQQNNVNAPLKEESNGVSNYIKSLGVPGALVENEPAPALSKKKSAFSFPSKKSTTTTSPKLGKKTKPTAPINKTHSAPIKPMVHTPVEPPPSDNNVMQRSKKSGYHNQKRELLRISRSIETDHSSKPNLKSDIQPSNISVIPSLPKDIKESKSIPLLGKPELNSTPISSSKQWLPNENAEDPFLILSKDEYHEHHSSIMQCRFNSQGNSIASCDKDGTVKVWKFEPSPVTIATVISRSPFLSVDWHKTASDLLILGTSQGVIRLFDTSSKLDQFDTIIPGNCPRITQLACHPNGATFATSCVSNSGYEGLRLNNSSPSNPGRVQIWNINESQITLESSILECNDRHIECLAYSENGICLATGDTNGLLTVLDTRTYKVILSREAHKGPIYTVQFSKDEKFVLTLGADGKFCAWNLASPIEPINLPIHALAGGPFEVTGFGGYKQVQQPGGGKLFTFEPNGSHVLTCDGTSAVIYDVNLSNASMSKVLTLVGHRSPVLSLEWTSSSKCGYCLTGSMDGRLLVTTLLNKLS